MLLESLGEYNKWPNGPTAPKTLYKVSAVNNVTKSTQSKACDKSFHYSLVNTCMQVIHAKPKTKNV